VFPRHLAWVAEEQGRIVGFAGVSGSELTHLCVDPPAQKRGDRSSSRIMLEGNIPNPMSPPSGCAFRARCPFERESAPRSHKEEPVLKDVGGGHFAACNLLEPGGAEPRVADSPGELQTRA
jgi:oligopeptide/dipeptide ABC transporter ATP-binding protein